MYSHFSSILSLLLGHHYIFELSPGLLDKLITRAQLVEDLHQDYVSLKVVVVSL